MSVMDRFIATGLDLDSVAAAVVGGTASMEAKEACWDNCWVLIIQILSTMVVLQKLMLKHNLS